MLVGEGGGAEGEEECGRGGGGECEGWGSLLISCANIWPAPECAPFLHKI